MNNPIGEYFDTRDLINYIEYLREELVDDYNNLELGEKITDPDEVEEWPDELYIQNEEYEAIRQFGEELSELNVDYVHGGTVISEMHWEEYVEEFVTECDYIPRDFPHWIVIDWEQTSANFSQDYGIVSYDGTDYYIRNT